MKKTNRKVRFPLLFYVVFLQAVLSSALTFFFSARPVIGTERELYLFHGSTPMVGSFIFGEAPKQCPPTNFVWKPLSLCHGWFLNAEGESGLFPGKNFMQKTSALVRELACRVRLSLGLIHFERRV